MYYIIFSIIKLNMKIYLYILQQFTHFVCNFSYEHRKVTINTHHVFIIEITL